MSGVLYRSSVSHELDAENFHSIEVLKREKEELQLQNEEILNELEDTVDMKNHLEHEVEQLKER